MVYYMFVWLCNLYRYGRFLVKLLGSNHEIPLCSSTTTGNDTSVGDSTVRSKCVEKVGDIVLYEGTVGAGVI